MTGGSKGPVDLDTHRGMVAQTDTEVRRKRLRHQRADLDALQRRYEELEKLLVAAPDRPQPEVAVAARYLIRLYAATLEAQDPRREKLIARALDDLSRLYEGENRPF